RISFSLAAAQSCAATAGSALEPMSARALSSPTGLCSDGSVSSEPAQPSFATYPITPSSRAGRRRLSAGTILVTIRQQRLDRSNSLLLLARRAKCRRRGRFELLSRRQAFKGAHAVRNEMEGLTFRREDRHLRAAID